MDNPDRRQFGKLALGGALGTAGWPEGGRALLSRANAEAQELPGRKEL
jgi:hypothetical protein